jgi:hypothetical protein
VNGNLSSGGNNTFTVTLNANPGITQVFPTGLTLDLTTFNYLVGCQVKPGFNDPNPSNNTYNETFT